MRNRHEELQSATLVPSPPAGPSVGGRTMRTGNARWGRLALAAAIALAVGFAGACACSNRHREVSATEFLTLAGQPLGSAFDTNLVGVARGRVYLSVWSAMPSSFGGGEDIVSCRLDDLPAALGARLRAGEDPWSDTAPTDRGR
ncbi:MAG: hypothetical protein KDE27_28870 [Planctomycetes bacterium]|nr:hypothetical protein [Planctomycetota bacterium]